MPWLWVNQTALRGESAVPMPSLALVVQRGSIPGEPGALVMGRSSLSKRSLFEKSSAKTFLLPGDF